MNDYKSPLPLNQGSTKLSEISIDIPSALLGSPSHDSALRVTEQLLKITADLLRRQNYFLRSVGKIYWDGSKINLDDGAIANDMIFDILQTENDGQPNISIKIAGNAIESTSTSFKAIELADNELIYLELDPAIVAAAGTTLIIENALDGGSSVPGKTLRKVSMASGMPKIVSPVDGTTSTTYYIPVAYRKGSNIHWIPHGITWTAGTISPLGAVLVDGFQAYPEKFVDSELKLLSAINDLNFLGGGVILITGSFGIDVPITVPSNTLILGRGAKTTITLSNGGYFILKENCTLENFRILAAANFTGNAVHMNYGVGSKRARLKNMIVDLSQAVDVLGGPSFNLYAVDAAKFNATINDSINSIAVQPDGKILVAGGFTNYGGTNGRNYLIRLNSDGTLDTDFCAAAVDVGKFNNVVNVVVVQPDGKILVGGNFTNYGISNRNRLIRLNSNGTVDGVFCNNAVDVTKFNGSIAAIAIQSDGSIIIGGDFSSYGGTAGRDRLIKLSSTGVLDTAFCTAAVDGTKFNGAVYSITIQSNGQILVGGAFSSYGGTSNRNRLIRLNADNTLDTDFCTAVVDGSKFANMVRSIVIQSDGKILVGGDFVNYGGNIGRSYLVRFNANNSVDTDFCAAAVDGTKFNGSIAAIVIQSDGKILVGGGFVNYAGNPFTTSRDRLVRLNADGSVDTDFCNNATDAGKFNGRVRSIAVRSNNKILIGGFFTNYAATVNRNYFVQINADGTVDPSTIPAINVTGVRVEASNCRIYDCWFKGVINAAQRTAINYVSGYSDNADVDSLFE